MHNSTGGSATSLPMSQYTELLNNLSVHFDCQIILTTRKGEEELARQLAEKLTSKAAIYAKNDGLQDFAYSIACADICRGFNN